MITDTRRSGKVRSSPPLRKESVRDRLRALGPYLPQYFGYLLFHVIAMPILAIRSLLLAQSHNYAGLITRRLLGGSRPPAAENWTLILGTYLGETRTALRAAEEIRQANGQAVAVLTSTTEAYTVARSSAGECPVGVAPFNNPISILIMLLRWRPEAILCAEYCDLHHLLFLAKLFGIPLVLFNFHLSDKEHERCRRRAMRSWRYALVSIFTVQTKVHQERLQSLGIEKARIFFTGPSLAIPTLGDTEAIQAKWRNFIPHFRENTPLIVAGCTHAEEEPDVLRAFQSVQGNHPQALLVLAPRALQRVEECESALQQAGIRYVRRSMVSCVESSVQAVLLDTLGELCEIYCLASVAYIGGSLMKGCGGHSPLEALYWGIPITIGPEFETQEACVRLLEQAGIATVCRDARELAQIWERTAHEPAFCCTLSQQSRMLREQQSRIYASLFTLLEPTQVNRSAAFSDMRSSVSPRERTDAL